MLEPKVTLKISKLKAAKHWTSSTRVDGQLPGSQNLKDLVDPFISSMPHTHPCQNFGKSVKDMSQSKGRGASRGEDINTSFLFFNVQLPFSTFVFF